MFRKTLSSALIGALLVTSFGPAAHGSFPPLHPERVGEPAVFEQQAIVQMLGNFSTSETISKKVSSRVIG